MSDPLTPSVRGEGAEPLIPELRRLGQQLAQARQTAGMSQDALTQRLRLAPRQLQALEEGDHTRLPEGVFVVALARRVAEALNADVDEALQAVRESRLMRRSVPAVRPASPEGGAEEAVRPVPPPIAPREADPGVPDSRGPGAPPPSPVTVSSESQGGDFAHHPGPPGPDRWPLAALAALVVAGALATVWLSRPRPSPQGVATLPAPAPAPGPVATPASATAPAASPAAANSLRLQASEPSWVEVRDLGGRTLFEGILTGEKRFPVGSGIEVIAGRPHAVRASVGAAPAEALGSVTDIRWKRFSAAGSALHPPSLPPTP
ncbi:MAG: helix-turn-helix domain-containing protein [Cyanobacteria bacterium K_Offshore_surface_m2_239]|nr:helix-turn-helix domain-containing protein [Cyanobacteria bacterium K_Offshore_surface_m2_239]